MCRVLFLDFEYTLKCPVDKQNHMVRFQAFPAAARIGLANRVAPGETLMDEAYKWATRLKDGPLYALGVTKT